MPARTLAEHLDASIEPKRILSLDGGGVRGILTLGILEEIERLLRERDGDDPDFRLCDYFDLIGGTSTGAIIAAGLAIGKSVAELKELYVQLASEVFQPALFRRGLLRPKFSADPLRRALRDQFGDIRLGGPELRTGLLIMTKRIDTGSPWPLDNNPAGRYYDPSRRGSDTPPNKDFPLREVARASTAAPHYFEPESIRVSPDVTGKFVDGGVSPHNNPALALLMQATISGYGYSWATGEARLLLCSVGTGRGSTDVDLEGLGGRLAAGQAALALASLMDDCTYLNQSIMQWISRSPTAVEIDRVVGELDDLLTPEPLLTYLRYDATLEAKWLLDELAMDVSEDQARALQRMDDPAHVQELEDVGSRVAERFVRAEHFSPAFDG